MSNSAGTTVAALAAAASFGAAAAPVRGCRRKRTAGGRHPYNRSGRRAPARARTARPGRIPRTEAASVQRPLLGDPADVGHRGAVRRHFAGACGCVACPVSTDMYFSIGASRRPAFFLAGLMIRSDVISLQSGQARRPVAISAGGPAR